MDPADISMLSDLLWCRSIHISTAIQLYYIAPIAEQKPDPSRHVTSEILAQPATLHTSQSSSVLHVFNHKVFPQGVLIYLVNSLESLCLSPQSPQRKGRPAMCYKDTCYNKKSPPYYHPLDNYLLYTTTKLTIGHTVLGRNVVSYEFYYWSKGGRPMRS